MDVKRQKKSSNETGVAKLTVSPVKKISADDTTVPATNSVKTESKNQRRKRERKEQNKLANVQEKVAAKATAEATAYKSAATTLVKQASKDGKIKSKNFNLFAQFNTIVPDAEKAASDPEKEDSDVSDSEEEAVSEKLKKQISASINSYSLEKASQGSPTKLKDNDDSSHLQTPTKGPTPAKIIDQEISSFSDEL